VDFRVTLLSNAPNTRAIHSSKVRHDSYPTNDAHYKLSVLKLLRILLLPASGRRGATFLPRSFCFLCPEGSRLCGAQGCRTW